MINQLSSNLSAYNINDSSVICNHKLLLNSKIDILSKKLVIPARDIRNLIMNTKTIYSEVINPVVIEPNDIQQNLQSSLYIKGVDTSIHGVRKDDGYYLKKTHRVKLLEDLYKIYESELKIDINNCGVIYDFLKQQYIDVSKSTNITKSMEHYLQEQTLYALWEYTSVYPDNKFPVDRWIFYRSQNDTLYSNDVNDSFLNKNGKLITSLNKEYKKLKWQPTKPLILKNK